MATKGRKGLRSKPAGGWPLDQVLVGVGTVRTLRELILEAGRSSRSAPRRPWDVALWSGVSVQGSGDCLERLRRAELVRRFPPDRRGRARRYRLDATHPLARPLIGLFEAERIEARRTGRQRSR